jgi:hypothetical protein
MEFRDSRPLITRAFYLLLVLISCSELKVNSLFWPKLFYVFSETLVKFWTAMAANIELKFIYTLIMD